MTRLALAITAALIAAPLAGTAEPQSPGFKRIGAPAPGSGPRIDIRVNADAQARLSARAAESTQEPAEPADDADASGDGDHAWFWRDVSADMADAQGRFQRAIAALDGAGPDTAPDRIPLARLRAIAAAHGPDILRASADTQVSPALAVAVIAVESSGRPDAVSPRGAQGLMQLIPATAARFGVRDAHDAAQNIAGGIGYLDWLLGAFDSDVVLALAGYNAGEGALRQNDGVPPYAETRAYVPRVLAAWRTARGLCRTPPELPSDPCVFQLAASS